MSLHGLSHYPFYGDSLMEVVNKLCLESQNWSPAISGTFFSNYFRELFSRIIFLGTFFLKLKENLWTDDEMESCKSEIEKYSGFFSSVSSFLPFNMTCGMYYKSFTIVNYASVWSITFWLIDNTS